MRRFGVVLLLVPLVACGALRDMFSAHADDVATAAGQSLSAEQLGGWASQLKGMPLQADNLTRFTRIWVDYTVFASAMAGGRNLDDSTLIAAAMWPTLSQTKWEYLRERLVAGRTNMAPRQVDSAYNAGQLRAFQHILFQVTANASPDVVARTRKRMDGVWGELQASHGGNFAALARKYSDDGSKASGGFLGVSGRGKFIRPFEDAAWKLGPGEMSGVIQTPFGFHIIRRPPLSEVRDSFALAIQQHIDEAFDSTYIDRVRTLRHFSVEGSALAAARSAFRDADAAEDNSTKLVSYDGGAFRVRDLVRWLRALDPQMASAVPGANDHELSNLLETMATRDVLLQQADSAKVVVHPDDWNQLKAEYDSMVAHLEDAIQLTPAILRDSASSPAARAALATTHVNQYLDQVVARRRGFFGVPPFLAAALRASTPWEISSAGIQRATEQAQADRQAAGGGPSGPGTGGQPPLRPAPGPAPIPGATKPQGGH